MVPCTGRCRPRRVGSGASTHPRRRGKYYAMLSLRLRYNVRLQSIPSIPYLEKEFACHALHLPLGQSTVSSSIEYGTVLLTNGPWGMNLQDQAHLPNERISLSNLRRGKRVVERFLSNVAGVPRTPTAEMVVESNRL